MQRGIRATTTAVCSVDALHNRLAVPASSLRVRSFASAQTAQHIPNFDAVKSTVNPDEVARFSKLSSLWWDEQGECAQLHRMNPVRMQFIREKVAEISLEDNLDALINESQIFQGLDVLDVGCGGGLLSESLTRLGANTLGIDASSSNIQIASLHASSDLSLSQLSESSQQSHDKGKGKLAYKHTTVEDLLEERGPASFDIVCSMEVLEHVDNPRRFLSSCAQLVKPGGHLFLSTISRTPLGYLLTILMAENALRLVEQGTHTYSKYIRPDELEGFFRTYHPTSKTGGSTRPWITGSGSGRPSRVEAEVRGMVYLPWQGGWSLAPRWSKWAEMSNYCFWVRRPIE